MKRFIGISSFQILAMFRRGLFFSYLTIYLRHYLGLSVTATTLFTTLPMIVNVLAQRYAWGVLSDRLQKRRLLIVWGELIAGAGTILLFYAHRLPGEATTSGWVIITGLAMIEMFWSMSNIGWSALIADVYHQGERSRIMGRLESIGGLGRVVGILCGGLLYDRMGTAYAGWGFYEGSLFWIAGLIMFISIFPMFLVPEGGISATEKIDSLSGHSPSFVPAIFFTFLLAMALIHFGRNAVTIIIPQYLSLSAGPALSPLSLSHVINLRSAGLILAGLATGRLCRRIGERVTLVMASGIAVLALALMGIFVNIPLICLSSFLMGISEVLVIAASYELAAAYIPPEKRGTYFALFNATLFLSWGIGATLIAGPVTDGLMAIGTPESAAYMAAFIACAAVVLAGTLVLSVLFRMEKKQE
jgi:MFS family permease